MLLKPAGNKMEHVSHSYTLLRRRRVKYLTLQIPRFSQIGADGRQNGVFRSKNNPLVRNIDTEGLIIQWQRL
jgi:hypothetical protein